MSSDKGGAQIGNKNAAKGKLFESALKRALANYTNESVSAGLDKVADNVVVAAIEKKEQWAIREIADRMDGKAAQSLTVGGDSENPLEVIGKIKLIRPKE